MRKIDLDKLKKKSGRNDKVVPRILPKMANYWAKKVMKSKAKWKLQPKFTKSKAYPRFQDTKKKVFSSNRRAFVQEPQNHVSREIHPLTRCPTPKPRSIKKTRRHGDHVKKQACRSLKTVGQEFRKSIRIRKWREAVAAATGLENVMKVTNQHPRELAIRRGRTKINIPRNDQNALLKVKQLEKKKKK